MKRTLLNSFLAPPLISAATLAAAPAMAQMLSGPPANPRYKYWTPMPPGIESGGRCLAGVFVSDDQLTAPHPELGQRARAAYAWIGGRRLDHGRALSSCAAMRTSRSSRPYAATSWTPTGRPAELQWSGSETAG
jgi:hypothetical protein